MKAVLLRVNDAATGGLYARMVSAMLVNGSKTPCMIKDYCANPTATNTKETGC